jgi:hypothetical protein
MSESGGFLITGSGYTCAEPEDSFEVKIYCRTGGSQEAWDKLEATKLPLALFVDGKFVFARVWRRFLMAE